MAIKDGLLADFDHEMGTTRKLLERLPEDKLAWKPHVKSMTLAGLATHLGNIPQWAGTILNETSFDLAAAPPNLAEKTSRAEILAAFDDACKRTRGQFRSHSRFNTTSVVAASELPPPSPPPMGSCF